MSHPETNRAGREYMTTLVDGRYVTSSAVREAVVEAYGTQLAPDRYPFAVVDLEVPPGGVDVNVHPRKLEVLFVDEAGVSEQVRTAVRSALLEEGLVRSRAPRGRSAPEQTEVSAGESGTDDGADRGGGPAGADGTESAEGGDGGRRPGAGAAAGPTGASGGTGAADSGRHTRESGAPAADPEPGSDEKDGDGTANGAADGERDGGAGDDGKPTFHERPT